MRIIAGLGACVVALVLCGCDEKPKPAAPVQTATQKPAAPITDPKPVEHQVSGRITRLDDGPYPMFTLTLQPPAGDALSLDLNAEDVDLSGLEIAALKPGLGVTVTYISREKPDLMDMTVDHRGGERSVLGSDAPKNFDPAWKNITGTLSDAGAPSGGDLPDTITVTDRDGKKVRFDIYINDEMVPANGKLVTAFYDMRTENRVTQVRR